MTVDRKFPAGLRISAAVIIGSALFALAQPASADTVYWTDWTSATLGQTTGKANGTITTPGGTITVTYSGEVTSNTVTNGTYPSWQPATSYADGTIVPDAPNIDDIIAQNGGSATGVNTITFSVPILNPVMSIWSLGDGNDNANYTFTVSEPYTIVAGGPSNEYGGGPLVPNGGSHSVTGSEGNGTLFFNGTYSQITFTNTVYEGWYGFTLGVNAIAPPVQPGGVPEPITVSLFGAGLAGAAAMRRRTKKS
jgi:hypothetical protein